MLRSLDLTSKNIIIFLAFLASILCFHDTFLKQTLKDYSISEGIPRIQKETPLIAQKVLHYLHYLGGGREMALFNILTLLAG